MADYPVAGKATHSGVNRGGLVVVEHELVQALANTDTLTLTLPVGIDKDLLPIHATAFNNADPRVRQTNFGITSHDKDTGVTVLTATGAVADSSTIVILYAPVTLGT